MEKPVFLTEKLVFLNYGTNGPPYAIYRASVNLTSTGRFRPQVQQSVSKLARDVIRHIQAAVKFLIADSGRPVYLHLSVQKLWAKQQPQ